MAVREKFSLSQLIYLLSRSVILKCCLFSIVSLSTLTFASADEWKSVAIDAELKDSVDEEDDDEYFEEESEEENSEALNKDSDAPSDNARSQATFTDDAQHISESPALAVHSSSEESVSTPAGSKSTTRSVDASASTDSVAVTGSLESTSAIPEKVAPEKTELTQSTESTLSPSYQSDVVSSTTDVVPSTDSEDGVISTSVNSHTSQPLVIEETSSSYATSTPPLSLSSASQVRITLDESPRTEIFRTITAPVIKMLYKDDLEDENIKVISLEENKLALDDKGKGDVLIDVSDLPVEIIENTLEQLQLSLRYRRHCSWDDLRNDPWVAGTGFVTQEVSAKPVRDHLYRLTVNLCPEDAYKTFSLQYHKKKRIRSVVSKFGDSMGFLALAKFFGRWSAERTISGKQVRTPNGDDGGFIDTLAATLPAGAVFNGLAGLTESMADLSGYDSGLTSCMTAALSFSTMQILDRNFQSNTEQMFISNAGRLYSRSAYFGELFKCLKTLVDVPVYHWYSETHYPQEPELDNMSAATTALIANLMLLSLDASRVHQAELLMLEKNKMPKLELATGGTTIRGGVASAPYKLLGAADLYLEGETWTDYSKRTAMDIIFYLGGAALLKWFIPIQTREHNIPINGQTLRGPAILGANFIEASNAHLYTLFDEAISKPLGDMAAEALIANDYTVPDSYFHRASKVSVRLGVNYAAVALSITAMNKIADWNKKIISERVPLSGSAEKAGKKAMEHLIDSQRFFISVMTGASTNGAVIPLVMSLGEDFITPVSDGASFYLCKSNNWGVGCPTTELQLRILVDKVPMPVTDHALESFEVSEVKQ